MKNKSKAKVIVSVILILIALSSLYPLIWMIINSFKGTDEIMTGSSFGLPKEWIFSNYKVAIFDKEIFRYFLNSVCITACTIVLTVAISIMLSYALNRMIWKYSDKVNYLITWGILLPSQIVIVPVFIMLRNLNLNNNPIGLVLTISAFNIAMLTLIAGSFMKGIPLEMEEAAVMDGANLFRILVFVIMPIMKPAIATMCINVFISSWNEFIYALVILSGERYRTLPIALMKYSSGNFGVDYGGMFAAMVITSVFPIILFAFFSDEVEKAISPGAILK